jgi:hypothetical protein
MSCAQGNKVSAAIYSARKACDAFDSAVSEGPEINSLDARIAAAGMQAARAAELDHRWDQLRTAFLDVLQRVDAAYQDRQGGLPSNFATTQILNDSPDFAAINSQCRIARA